MKAFISFFYFCYMFFSKIGIWFQFNSRNICLALLVHLDGDKERCFIHNYLLHKGWFSSPLFQAGCERREWIFLKLYPSPVLSVLGYELHFLKQSMSQVLYQSPQWHSPIHPLHHTLDHSTDQETGIQAQRGWMTGPKHPAQMTSKFLKDMEPVSDGDKT